MHCKMSSRPLLAFDLDMALQDYHETLDYYIAAQDAAKALNAQKQAIKDEADEFTHLGQMDVIDDFE